MMVGKRFGKFFVIKKHHVYKYGLTQFQCRCNCGNRRIILGVHLADGRADEACDCHVLKPYTPPAKKPPTHKMRYTVLYTCWLRMKRRCLDKRDRGYRDYGGRGIAVCKRWQKSFDNFYADMGEKPSKRHSIDRINNDGNYKPSNCRWATPRQQVLNSRHCLKGK